MSGARDAAMMRTFRHECGILCAILTGLMESTHHTRLILNPSPRSDAHCSALGRFHQYMQTTRFPCPGRLAIGVGFAVAPQPAERKGLLRSNAGRRGRPGMLFLPVCLHIYQVPRQHRRSGISVMACSGHSANTGDGKTTSLWCRFCACGGILHRILVWNLCGTASD